MHNGMHNDIHNDNLMIIQITVLIMIIINIYSDNI